MGVESFRMRMEVVVGLMPKRRKDSEICCCGGGRLEGGMEWRLVF
jgi:hypothetical protein